MNDRVNDELALKLLKNDPSAYKCKVCGKSCLGDPRLHEVYEFDTGVLIGYRHRKCKRLLGKTV